MHYTGVAGAKLSQKIFQSKKVFEKQLDLVPSTVFQYFYQTRVKELQSNSTNSSSADILRYVQYNNAFKRYIRKEWDCLSDTKKRIYYAFFFHFSNLDYKTLNEYELARIIEIPTPAISEYMLFRNKFKRKYDTIWPNDNISNERKTAVVATLSNGTKQRLILNTERQRKPLIMYNKRSNTEKITNLTKRFQAMCRECRAVWSTHISDAKKLEIKNKWKDQKRQFELRLQCERNILDHNLQMLSQAQLFHSSLLIEKPVSKHANLATLIFLPLSNHKKS